MLKRVVALFCLIVAVTLGTVFAAPNLAGNENQTMSALIKGEQKLTFETERTTTFKDQTILMMYIRAIDKMMMVMTPDQLRATDNAHYLSRGTTLNQRYTAPEPNATKAQLMISIDKKMLDMTQAQLAAMLDKVISLMTNNQMNFIVKDNNSAMMKTGVDRFNVLQSHFGQ